MIWLRCTRVEIPPIQALFDGADRQTAEILLLSVVNVGVVRVGAHRENLVGSDIAPAAVLLTRMKFARRFRKACAAAARSGERAGSGAATPARGSEAAAAATSFAGLSGTSESRNAPETPKATNVVSSARVFRDSAELARDELRNLEA